MTIRFSHPAGLPWLAFAVDPVQSAGASIPAQAPAATCPNTATSASLKRLNHPDPQAHLAGTSQR